MAEGPPQTPAEPPTGADPAPEDGTLGGYLRVHHRPPAFQGSDGHPYTVSLEAERTPDLAAPFAAYLVFPRWAETGVGITGHLETPTVRRCRTREEAERALGALSLREVHELLEAALRTKNP